MDISAFDPPEDYRDMGLLFWPAMTDQIELVRRRQEQLGRVLNHYTGKERDYHDLTRESTILLGVLHTLRAAEKLLKSSSSIEPTAKHERLSP